MLWGLVIIVCLAHDGEVECGEWRAEPFKTKYLCQKELDRWQTELKKTEHQYIYMRCERGHYS